MGMYGWPSKLLIPQASNQILLPISLENSEVPWFVLSIKPARFLAFLQYCHRDKTGIFKRDMVLTDCKKEEASNFYFWLKAKPVSAGKVWAHQVFLSPFPMEHWPNLALSIKVSMAMRRRKQESGKDEQAFCSELSCYYGALASWEWFFSSNMEATQGVLEMFMSSAGKESSPWR